MRILIDIMDESDTNGYWHGDDGYLLKQMFHPNREHSEFDCEEVTCSNCKTTFNVKGLEW